MFTKNAKKHKFPKIQNFQLLQQQQAGRFVHITVITTRRKIINDFIDDFLNDFPPAGEAGGK